ncbi:glycosyl hydrolase family 61-domain-containing protein [Mycena floridula]|nr:glycosyl hydrolase family 61-domain-containing protein [Mycena floridula]
MISFILPIALLISHVAAHGQVMQVTIDGKAFAGNLPGSTPKSSIIRLISNGDPLHGATNPDINCGRSAQIAASLATAMPDSVLQFKWTGEDGKANWPHNTGPMLTYLASCGDTPCNKFNSSKAQWFKIQQDGRKANGDWLQADLLAGQTAKVTLPSNLAAGNYIVRHEIIALHLATTKGGAEFYPSCAQLTVGGTQTGKPTASDLVSIPGAYKDTDPGIFDPTVFDTGSKYIFPGPAIASFVTGKTTTSASNTTSTAPSKTTSASTTTSTSKATCKKKRAVSSREHIVVPREHITVPREHQRRVMKLSSRKLASL